MKKTNKQKKQPTAKHSIYASLTMKKVKIIPAQASWEVLPQSFSILMSLHMFTSIPLIWFCLLSVNIALLTFPDNWKKTKTASYWHWMKIWDHFCNGYNSYVRNIKLGKKTNHHLLLSWNCLSTIWSPATYLTICLCLFLCYPLPFQFLPRTLFINL